MLRALDLFFGGRLATTGSSLAGEWQIGEPGLDFAATTDRSMDLSLGGVSPGSSSLSSATALRGFTGTGQGAFSYDAPDPSGAIPEPSTWGLMILGFGVLGARLRRRRSGMVTA